MGIDINLLAEAFHPVEAAIARIALGMPANAGDDQLDLCDHGKNLPDGTVHLETGDENAGGDDQVRAASDALARLVLAGFEDRLPVWSAITESNGFVVSRKGRAKRKAAVLAIGPQLLLEVNWADSGPGFSWPEAHHLGWLPGFNRWVVTASRDTPEIDGFCDRVLATFEHCTDPLAEAKRILQGYWQGLKDEYDQPRWEYLFKEGRISSEEADEMAEAVWPDDFEEEQEDDLEED